MEGSRRRVGWQDDRWPPESTAVGSTFVVHGVVQSFFKAEIRNAKKLSGYLKASRGSEVSSLVVAVWVRISYATEEGGSDIETADFISRISPFSNSFQHDEPMIQDTAVMFLGSDTLVSTVRAQTDISDAISLSDGDMVDIRTVHTSQLMSSIRVTQPARHQAIGGMHGETHLYSGHEAVNVDRGITSNIQAVLKSPSGAAVAAREEKRLREKQLSSNEVTEEEWG